MSDSNRGSNQGLKKLPGFSTKTKDMKSGRPPRGKHRRPAPVQARVRTPEEEKAYREGQQKALEAAQKRAQTVSVWENSIPHMSFRQIRSELRRVINSGHVLGEPTTPINVAQAICALITLENTKTRENFAGKLSAVLNPTIVASSPRYVP